MLASRGFEIATASDAVSAISTAVAERPGLILLDMGLPAGNGVVVLQRLRALPTTAFIPVVLLTGGMVDFDREQALSELGCDTILTKPVTTEQLMTAINAVLATGDQLDEHTSVG
jgi:DNA-binding response OmpR family regulator